MPRRAVLCSSILLFSCCHELPCTQHSVEIGIPGTWPQSHRKWDVSSLATLASQFVFYPTHFHPSFEKHSIALPFLPNHHSTLQPFDASITHFSAPPHSHPHHTPPLAAPPPSPTAAPQPPARSQPPIISAGEVVLHSGGAPALYCGAKAIRQWGRHEGHAPTCVHVWSAPHQHKERDLVFQLVKAAIKEGKQLNEIAILYRYHKLVSGVRVHGSSLPRSIVALIHY